MQIRPHEKKRREDEQPSREANGQRKEQLEERGKKGQREELRPVGPGDLGDEQRRDDEWQRDPPGRSTPARESHDKEGRERDERRAEDRDTGPPRRRKRAREGELPEPFPDPEVHARDRRGEDVLPEERVVVEHPPAHRELPVRIGVGRRQPHRDDEDRTRNRERVRAR